MSFAAFLERVAPGTALAGEVELVDGVADVAVVVGGGSAFDGVDAEEPAECRVVDAGSHLDVHDEACGVFGAFRVVADPAVIPVPVRVVRQGGRVAVLVVLALLRKCIGEPDYRKNDKAKTNEREEIYCAILRPEPLRVLTLHELQVKASDCFAPSAASQGEYDEPDRC